MHVQAQTKLHAEDIDVAKCRLCGCHLDTEEDDIENRVCNSCKSRPEARRLGIPSLLPQRGGLTTIASRETAARGFTEAEKSLIRKVHGYIPAMQLLDLLNERLACDLGPDAVLYPMEQLHAEMASIAGAVPVANRDWAGLRKLLSKAKRDGVLAVITGQVIDDFAVVYSLNPRQVLSLKDIVLQFASEGE